MATDTFTTKQDEAQAEAKNTAHQASAAAHKVGNAVKSAGRKASAAAGEEISNLKADLDDLISRFSNLSEAEVEEAKEKLIVKIASTREAASGMADNAREQIREGIECSEDYVKGHPMQSVGYAALAGLLLGVLITRR